VEKVDVLLVFIEGVPSTVSLRGSSVRTVRGETPHLKATEVSVGVGKQRDFNAGGRGALGQTERVDVDLEVLVNRSSVQSSPT